MRLALDLDGVIFDWNTAFWKLLTNEAGDKVPKEWIVDGRVEPPCWDWDIEAGYTKSEISQVWAHITRKDSIFWKNLDPLPEARKVIRRLNYLSVRNHEVLFVTNRMGWNAKRQTENALYELGMNFPTVILASDKVPLLKSLEVNYFIDDRLQTINDCKTGGLGAVSQYFLLDKPYNRKGRLDYRVVNSVRDSLDLIGVWK